MDLGVHQPTHTSTSVGAAACRGSGDLRRIQSESRHPVGAVFCFWVLPKVLSQLFSPVSVCVQSASHG